MRDDEGERKNDGEQTDRKPRVRQPYETPRVETHPLFERMALNCDVYWKNTGEDDFS